MIQSPVLAKVAGREASNELRGQGASLFWDLSNPLRGRSQVPASWIPSSPGARSDPDDERSRSEWTHPGDQGRTPCGLHRFERLVDQICPEGGYGTEGRSSPMWSATPKSIDVMRWSLDFQRASCLSQITEQRFCANGSDSSSTTAYGIFSEPIGPPRRHHHHARFQTPNEGNLISVVIPWPEP